MIDEPASPVCYATQADESYMGYASRDELLAALNELLEAERAGTKVALASIHAAGRAYATLMASLRKDEAQWCAMLSRQIRRLSGAPSRKTGGFHGKAIAVADPCARLAFINRGQAWVVRKLEALTPRIRDDALHAELRSMLAGHKTNIAITEAFLRKELSQNPAK